MAPRWMSLNSLFRQTHAQRIVQDIEPQQLCNSPLLRQNITNQMAAVQAGLDQLLVGRPIATFNGDRAVGECHVVNRQNQRHRALPVRRRTGPAATGQAGDQSRQSCGTHERRSMDGRHGPRVWPLRDEMGGVINRHGVLESSLSSRLTINRCRQLSHSTPRPADHRRSVRCSMCSAPTSILESDCHLPIW